MFGRGDITAVYCGVVFIAASIFVLPHIFRSLHSETPHITSSATVFQAANVSPNLPAGKLALTEYLGCLDRNAGYFQDADPTACAKGIISLIQEGPYNDDDKQAAKRVLFQALGTAGPIQ